MVALEPCSSVDAVTPMPVACDAFEILTPASAAALVRVTPALFVLAKELTIVSSVKEELMPEVVPDCTSLPTFDAPPEVVTLSLPSDAL